MILEFGLNSGQSKFLRLPQSLRCAFRRYDGQKTGAMNARVVDEHERIAATYDYSDKYSIIGKIETILFKSADTVRKTSGRSIIVAAP